MVDEVVPGNPFREEFPTQVGETQWGDTAKNIGAGVLELGAGLAGLTEYATQGRYGQDVRKFLSEAAEYTTELMSPRAQQNLRASYLPDDGQDNAWQSFWSSTTLKATRSLPSLAASGLTAYVTRSPVATMMVAGGMTAGDVAKDIFESVEKQSDAQLRETSPLYAGYRDLMDEADARRAFSNDIAGLKPVVAGAVSAFATRYLGVEGAILKQGAGKATGGIARQTLATAAGEAGQEAFEETTNSLLGDYARLQGGIGEISLFRAAQAGVEGAVIGGVLGGVTGPLVADRSGSNAGAGAGTVPPKSVGTGATPPPVATPGIGNTTNPPSGSPNQYPKAQAAKAKSKQRSGVQAVDGPVDTTQAAALGAVPPNVATSLSNVTVPPADQVTSEVPPVASEAAAPAAVPQNIADSLGNLTQPPTPAAPTVPETTDQLAAQVKELVDGVRQVALLPKGAPKVELPKGFESVTLRGRWYPADTRGTYYFNPANVTSDQIKAAAKANKLNELLNMGPTPKEASDGTVVQGVNPEGVATVQQATNEQAAPADAQAIAERMPPGSTVEKTTAPTAIQARREGQPKAPGTPFGDQTERVRTAAVESQQQWDKTNANIGAMVDDSFAKSNARRQAQGLPPQTREQFNAEGAEFTARVSAGERARDVGNDQRQRASSPAAPTRAPRVLEAAGNAETQKLYNERVKQNLGKAKAEEVKAKKEQEAVASSEAPKFGAENTGTKDTKRKREQAANEAIAKEVFDAFPPTEAETAWNSDDKEARTAAREALVGRVNRALVAAGQRGFKMPEAIRKQANEVVWLKELQNFATTVGSKGLGRSASFERLTTREADLRASDEKAGLQARESRKVEGDEKNRRDQGDVEAKADAVEQAAPISASEVESATSSVGEDAVLDAIDEKKQAEREARRAEARVLTPEEERAAELERRATELAAKTGEDADAAPVVGKDKAGTFAKVSGRERLKQPGLGPTGKVVLKKKSDQALASLDEDLSGQAVFTVDENGDLQAGTSLQTTDVRSLFGEYDVPMFQKVFGRNALSTLNLGMFKRRLIALVGDVPVHIVDPNSPLLDMGDGKRARGYYDRGNRQIILAAHHVIDPQRGAQLLIHEATHAAFESAIEADPRIKNVLEEMRDALKKEMRSRGVSEKDLPYGLADIQEFIAEAFSNPTFQKLLGSMRVDPQLATELDAAFGVTRGRIKTYWDMFTEMLRFALRLPDNAYTMLDATLRIGRQLNETVAESGVQAAAVDGRLFPVLEDLREKSGDTARAAASWAQGAWTKFRTGHQLEQDFRRSVLGPEVKRINDAVAAAGPKADKIRDEGRKLAQQAIDLAKKHPKDAETLADLAEQVRMLDVTLEGNNDFGKKESSQWQAKARLPALKASFADLDPEMQQLYRDMAAFYRKSHNQIVEANVRAIIDTLGAKGKYTAQELSTLTQRVMDNQLNENDKKALGDTLYTNLKNAREFHRVKGDYFPLMRFGDFVVTTEDKITDTMGGTEVEPGVVEFKGKTKAEARRNAEAFAKATPLTQLGRARTALYDRTTGKQVTVDEAKSLNDVETRYQVRVQTRGVEFFESRRAAEEFVRTNPKGYSTLSKPETRIGEGYQAHVMTGTQLGALERAIDARTDLKDGQKKLLANIVKQASVRMMSGNRIAQRRLKSQKVQGASADFARVLLQYNHAMANHITTAEAAPEIRDALDAMRKKLQGYTGDDRPTLVELQNEIVKRVDQGIHDINEPSVFMKDLMTVSSVARLASPAYSAIQMVQPTVTTLPILSGKFGPVRAMRAFKDAYSAIGFKNQALTGLFNTKEAITNFGDAGLLNAADPVGDIRKRLAGNKDELAMFEELVRLNAVNETAGFEVSSAVQDGRGKWGKVVAGVDRIARQLPQTIEVINRAVTGISSYRLARESGMDHEKATQYALDTVRNTQGDYSASNAPRFFNNPILRPAMQFRKYAQMMTYLMVDLTRQTLDKDLSVEERKVALKQILNIMAVQIAVAGSLSLPGLEIIKAGFLLASLLGLSEGWDEQEEKLRKLADDTFGRGLGQMVTSGVLTRLGGYGIDVSQRMSLSDMWLFGEPKKNDKESTEAYFFRLLVGAPGTLITGAFDGVKDLGNGEIEKGLSKLLPIKFAADIARGARQYNDPRADAGIGTAVVTSLGLRTAAQAERGRDISNSVRRKQKLEDESRRLARDFYNAKTRGERIKAAARNREFNKQLGKSDWRLRAPTNEDWERPQR